MRVTLCIFKRTYCLLNGLEGSKHESGTCSKEVLCNSAGERLQVDDSGIDEQCMS